MKHVVMALLGSSLLLSCARAQTPAPPPPFPAYEDKGYLMDAGGMMSMQPAMVIAIRAPDGLYVFQNADSAVLIWRDSVYLGAAKGFVTEEVARSRKPTDTAPEQFGPVGVMFLVKMAHQDHEDTYVAIIYRPE